MAFADVNGRDTATSVLFTTRIHFATHYGQQIAVVGSLPCLGGNDVHHALLLSYTDGGWWTGNWGVDSNSRNPEGVAFKYRYVLLHDDGMHQFEWGQPRSYTCSETAPDYIELCDVWRARSIATLLSTPSMLDTALQRTRVDKLSAITGCIASGTDSRAATISTTTAGFTVDRLVVRIRVQHAGCNQSQAVYIAGSIPQLGSWDVSKAVRMSDASFPVWEHCLEVDRRALPAHFKFLIGPSAQSLGQSQSQKAASQQHTLRPNPKDLHWEEGANREIALPQLIRLGSISDRWELAVALASLGLSAAAAAAPAAASSTSVNVGAIGGGGTKAPPMPSNSLMVEPQPVHVQLSSLSGNPRNISRDSFVPPPSAEAVAEMKQRVAAAARARNSSLTARNGGIDRGGADSGFGTGMHSGASHGPLEIGYGDFDHHYDNASVPALVGWSKTAEAGDGAPGRDSQASTATLTDAEPTSTAGEAEARVSTSSELSTSASTAESGLSRSSSPQQQQQQVAPSCSAGSTALQVDEGVQTSYASVAANAREGSEMVAHARPVVSTGTGSGSATDRIAAAAGRTTAWPGLDSTAHSPASSLATFQEQFSSAQSASASPHPHPHQQSMSQQQQQHVTLIEVFENEVRNTDVNWRAAGVSVPIFSLRSEHGMGVGDFCDIPSLVDWAGLCGLKLIQMLPVNDTFVNGRWDESSPFASTSVFALHPMYLNLHQVAADCEDRYAAWEAAQQQVEAADEQQQQLQQSVDGGGGRAPTLGGGSGTYTGTSKPPARVPADILSRMDQARAQLNSLPFVSSGGGGGGSSGAAPHSHGHQHHSRAHGLSSPSGAASSSSAAGQASFQSPPRTASSSSLFGRHNAHQPSLGGYATSPQSAAVPSPSAAPRLQFGTNGYVPPSSSTHEAQLSSRGFERTDNVQSRGPLDYEAMIRTKQSLIRELYRTIGDDVLSSGEFGTWFLQSRDWLQQYAVYAFMRDIIGTADPQQWGDRRSITPAQIQALTDPSQHHYKAIAYHYFVQYLLHQQLSWAATYARQRGIVLQIEVPPGVNRKSADVWCNPHLFVLDSSMGAPPDAFGSEGQCWGYPPFDWVAMERTNYAWWNRRWKHLGQYFSSILLNHVGEYFRTYRLPIHSVSGLGGVFHPCAPLTRDELAGLGLWDIRRLTAPYIREWSARSALGSAYAELAPRYFRVREGGIYEFTEQYSTEDAIKASLAGTPHEHLATPLIRLLNNTCLIATAAVSTPAPAAARSSSSAALSTSTAASSSQPPQLGTTGPQVPMSALPSPTSAALSGVLAASASMGTSSGEGSSSSSSSSSTSKASAAASSLPLAPGSAQASGLFGMALHFHPRADMTATTSFIELDEYTRGLLRRVYAAYFGQRQKQLWHDAGMRRLTAIQNATRMAVCADDIGCPREFRDALRFMGIPGLRLQRLPSEDLAAGASAASGLVNSFASAAGTASSISESSAATAASSLSAAASKLFSSPLDYEYPCSATTSTHDTPPLRSWWEADPALAAHFYRSVLGMHGDAPKQCTPDVARSILQQHMRSPALFTILPLQDLLAVDAHVRSPDPHGERINIPGLRGHYWRWRVHVTLEELLHSGAGMQLAHAVKTMVALGGRDAAAPLADVDGEVE